jgi:hypothetical protein
MAVAINKALGSPEFSLVFWVVRAVCFFVYLCSLVVCTKVPCDEIKLLEYGTLQERFGKEVRFPKCQLSRTESTGSIFDYVLITRRSSLPDCPRHENPFSPEECDKKCDKNPSVAAKVDVIGSSAGKGINKFRVFNIARRIRLTGSSQESQR